MARTPAPRIGKTVDLKSANKPTAYPTGGKPAVPEELKTAPRDMPGPDNSATGGNFKLPPRSTGAGFAQPGLDPGAGTPTDET